MATQQKILIIGPSWVGDMVMAQSLFIALKKHMPERLIDVLAPEWTRPLLARMPEVNQAIAMPITHGAFGWQQRRQIGKSLRGQYQQAIVLPNSWKSALIPWFANIPQRTGWLGEMRYGLLNDARRLDKQAVPLMVQRFVSLAHPANIAQIAPKYDAPKMQASNTILPTFVPPLKSQQKRLILCPGAEFGPAKQWPAEHYGQTAKVLIEHGWQVLILGSKADHSVGEAIATQVNNPNNCFNLCGKTQLGEAIDLLATADHVITNDSGLMHVTAALQKPLIAIYGPTSPQFTPPLSDNSEIVQIPVDCGPCFQRQCPQGHHKCMRDISAMTIVEKVNLAH